MTLSDFSSLLVKAKPRTILGCPGFSARCPAHEDDNPSFAVWESPDGWLHVKCQRGCSEDSILQSLNLTSIDRRVHLNGQAHKNTDEKVYVYTDWSGDYIFEKVRYYKNGKKSFYQRIANGDGTFTMDLSELGPMSKMFYRMHRIEEAIANGKRIFLNEGEKAVDALEARGEYATCQPGGAEGGRPESKWLPMHTELLAGAKEVIVVQDQDDTGRAFAKYVASELKKAGIPVRVVESKHRAEKADAFDHLAEGYSPDEFIAPIIETPAKIAAKAVAQGSLAQIVSEIVTEIVTEMEPSEFPLSDSGNAERLIHNFGSELRFVPAWGRWIYWNGWKWVSDETGNSKVFEYALATARLIQKQAWDCNDSDKRQTMGKWGFSSEGRGRLENMVALASKSRRIVVKTDDLDSHPWFVNLRNGVYDTKERRLISHNPDLLITKGIDVAYDQNAKCPIWQKFLLDVLAASPTMLRFIWKATGYSLTGDCSEQCFFFLHGNTGNNGKSTFIETLIALFGDYAKQTPTETLMAKFGDPGASNDVARLKDARFVAAPETEDGKRMNEGLIKRLTGQDRITARFLHQEFFEYTPQFKIWMSGNHRPEIRGTDDAIWRRVTLIPFQVTIPEEDRNPHLKTDLLAELPGILAWAISGCDAWHTERLGRPEEVQAALVDYRSSQDKLNAFLEDATEKVGADIHIQAGVLFKAYGDWCKANNEHAMSMTMFGKSMKARGEGAQDATSGLRYYCGRKLRREIHGENGPEVDPVYRGSND